MKRDSKLMLPAVATAAVAMFATQPLRAELLEKVVEALLVPLPTLRDVCRAEAHIGHPTRPYVSERKADAVHLGRHLFLAGPQPPPPFPETGPDPTPDEVRCERQAS